jgi:hypothetical protein
MERIFSGDYSLSGWFQTEFLSGLKCGDFNLQVPEAGILDHFLQPGGHIIRKPIGPALGANRGRNIPHQDHTKSQIN